MKKIFVSLSMITFCIAAHSQNTTLQDIKSAATKEVKTDGDTATDHKWKKGALVSLNVTQVSNNNWVASSGDAFSLSVNGSLNAYASKKWDHKKWDNILDVNYGIVNTTTLGVRKVNDLINYLSKLDIEPEGWKKVSLALLGQFRSQITSSFDYNYFGTTTKRRTSGFFAPAYITVSPGFDYHPNSWFSVFGSPLAVRWTIVSNDPYSYAAQGGVFNGNVETPLASLYGVDPAKENLGEFGAFVTINAKKEIMKNITYIGKMDLYSNYLKTPKDIALFSTNQVIMKVNKLINVSYELDLLDDNNIKQATNPGHAVGLQVLSTLGVGFAAKF